MKKLILVSLVLALAVCVMASLPAEHREGIVLPPIYYADDNSMELNSAPIEYREGIVVPPIYYADDNSMELNSAPIEYREGIVVPPIYYADDNSMELNSAPIEYREGIVVPPIYYADDNSMELNSAPRRRREGIVLPPCPNDLNGTHKLIKSEPNRRRGGIVVPPIQSDPYDNSKKREAVEISGINGSALVTVYNLMGVKMLETETIGPVKSSSLPSGRYIMQINTGDRIWYEKVIIMK